MQSTETERLNVIDFVLDAGLSRPTPRFSVEGDRLFEVELGRYTTGGTFTSTCETD
jgi:hypothetical protein